MKTLDFYDVVDKEKFSSNKYTKHTKMGRNRRMYYALTTAPSGKKSSRIISKADFKAK